MTYLDSSVLLRIVLEEEDGMDRAGLHPGVTSRLSPLECFRTLDRVRLRSRFDAASLLAKQENAHRILAGIDIVELEDPILRRAADSFPVPLKMLDAIHLATALRCREALDRAIRFATHDRALAAAARAYGFPVAGV